MIRVEVDSRLIAVVIDKESALAALRLFGYGYWIGMHGVRGYWRGLDFCIAPDVPLYED